MISTQLVTYIVDNGLSDDFQCAYKCGHSTETSLLHVYNDIVVTIGKGNGNFLVLLDLSSAFDTIDHNNLFTVLGKHVGICDDALNLIVSYLSDRKQQVRIDNIMHAWPCQHHILRFAGFCAGLTKVMRLYLLPLCSILKHHNIGYHIYASDIQLYISFKCNDTLANLPKRNSCILDIRVWMIKNILKINDSKREFIVFRSPQAKQDFSGLSISVVDSIISQLSKVTDLGVIFDQSLSFDDYTSGVCRSTHFHWRNIGRIRSLLSYEATAQLLHALITTRIDYCNSLLYNLPKCSIARLQKFRTRRRGF